MRRQGGVLSSLLSWSLAIAVTAACFRNVFWDSVAVERLAQAAACGERAGCAAQMTRMMRTPISHTYSFVAGGRPVEVECMREYILFGDYACKDGSNALPDPPPAPSASATPSPAVSSKPRR